MQRGRSDGRGWRIGAKLTSKPDLDGESSFAGTREMKVQVAIRTRAFQRRADLSITQITNFTKGFSGDLGDARDGPHLFNRQKVSLRDEQRAGHVRPSFKPADGILGERLRRGEREDERRLEEGDGALHGPSGVPAEGAADHHEGRGVEGGVGGDELAALAEPREVSRGDFGDAVAPLVDGDVAAVAEDDLVVVGVVDIGADAAADLFGGHVGGFDVLDGNRLEPS